MQICFKAFPTWGGGRSLKELFVSCGDAWTTGQGAEQLPSASQMGSQQRLYATSRSSSNIASTGCSFKEKVQFAALLHYSFTNTGCLETMSWLIEISSKCCPLFHSAELKSKQSGFRTQTIMLWVTRLQQQEAVKAQHTFQLVAVWWSDTDVTMFALFWIMKENVTCTWQPCLKSHWRGQKVNGCWRSKLHFPL